MKLQEIVKGADASAQQALDKLFTSLEEERILWYPSAGSDFRDLLETLSPERQALHGLSEAPNIFIHTTYIRDYVPLNLGVIRNDGRTVVEIQEKYEIVIKEEIDFTYQVSKQYAEFRDYASVEPLIHLLKLRLHSNVLGVVEGWLFYFHFENHNFLQEIILKQQLRISHLVKVREGLGMGGNRQSITLVYALLANIGVRYLFAFAFSSANFSSKSSSVYFASSIISSEILSENSLSSFIKVSYSNGKIDSNLSNSSISSY